MTGAAGCLALLVALQCCAQQAQPAPLAEAHDFSGAYTVAGSDAKVSCAPDMFVGISGTTHIIAGRKVIVLVREGDHSVRYIYLDAEHPVDLRPSVYGHSIGRFEDGTLVVETIGLKSGLTLVERFRLVDGNRLLEFTGNGLAGLARRRAELKYTENNCVATVDPAEHRQPSQNPVPSE